MKSKRLTGRDKFNRAKPIINGAVLATGILPSRLRSMLLLWSRNATGTMGLAARYILLKTIALSLGDNVSIHPGVYLIVPENLRIGRNISIHPMCYLDAEGGLTINDDVSIAHGASILTSTHTYEDDQIPMKYQEINYRPTIIENNVWIGAKATILGGSLVGTGSIVAAGAVVTRDVASNTIVAGVPARAIKNREAGR